MQLIKRIKGCLLGGALGDALGTAADSMPFGHSAHAHPDTCSTIIRTGSRSAATQGWHCYSEVPGVVNFLARLRIDSPLRLIR